VLQVPSRFRGERPFGVLRERDVVVVRPLDVTGAPEAHLPACAEALAAVAAADLAHRQDAADGLLLQSVGIPSLGICAD